MHECEIAKGDRRAARGKAMERLYRRILGTGRIWNILKHFGTGQLRDDTTKGIWMKGGQNRNSYQPCG